MTVTFADIHDLGIQNDGIGNLEYSGGKIGFRKLGRVASTEILNGFALKDIDIAFTAVKDDFLFRDGNAFNFLRSAEASTNFRDDLHIHGDADLIKTAVEGDTVNMDVGTDDLGALGADTAAAFDEFISDIGKINGNILKAILVAATVKDSMGVYIYRVTGTAAKGRCVSGIRHTG